MVSEDDNQSSRAPLSDGLGAQIQTSDNMPTWSSEVTHNFDQDPDNPLQDHENTNAAQQENAAKPYVPWFGDGSKLGPLSKFQLLLFNTRLVFLSFTLIFYICLTVLLLASPWYVRNWESFETNVGGYQAVFMSGIINWAPAECVYYILLSSPDSDKVTSGAVIVVGAILFGLLSWAYIAIVSNTNITYQVISPSPNASNHTFRHLFQAWSTGSLPHSFQGCNARVEPQQSSLFLPNIYDTQFARTVLTHSNSTMRSSFYPAFDMELSRSIQNNHTLCDSGFQGNVDLYELGIRTGLYLQWISASLANNLLPDTRQELQKVYLIFFLAICLATLVASFVKTCTFSIEIEIMYWMYLGGFVCVFATAPCSIKLGSEAKWIKLNWTTTILFTTHALMYYHGTWFIWYAYDQVFSRLPCGTYHFFLVPVLDPSETFWVLRDYLNHLLVPLIPLLTLFPFVGILLLSEIKHAIQDSAVYQILIKKTAILDSDQAVTTDSDDASVKKSLGLRLYQYIRGVYMGFREICDFPSHSREGIRLVTPIDVRKRRLVAFVDLHTQVQR